MPLARRQFQEYWSEYRIDATACAEAAMQMQDIAARLGFELPSHLVGVAPLKYSDTLSVATGPGRLDCDLYEYPLESRTGPKGPVILRQRIIEDMLRNLHAGRWKRMRRDAMAGMVGRDLDMHYDGTVLTRWACAIARFEGADVESHREEYVETLGTDIQAKTQINTPAGRITVDHQSILLPFQLPESLRAGIEYRRLGDILTLPSCGNMALDDDVLNERIYTLEDERVGVRERTRIRVYATLRKPMHDESADLPWRRLRAIRVDCDRMAPEYERIDPEVEAARYHAMCDKALGTVTQLPIPHVAFDHPEVT